MESTPSLSANAISQSSSIFNFVDCALLIITICLVIYIIILHKEKVKNQKQIIELEQLILEECKILKKCQAEKTNPFINEKSTIKREMQALNLISILQKELSQIDDFLNLD